MLGRLIAGRNHKTFQLFSESENRAEVSISIATELNILGQTEQATPYVEKTLTDMELIPIEESFYYDQLKLGVVKQFYEIGKQECANKIILESLQEAKKIDDVDERDLTLVRVGELYAEVGLYDQAIEIGLMIEDEFDRVWRLFESIIYTAIDENDHDQIFNVLAATECEGYTNYLLTEAIDSYASIGGKKIDYAIDRPSL